MMEFRNLRTFRAVAETLNFTKTASRLFMAQSSVSAQIQSLEDELGVKLFDRIGRRVLLTDAGRKLLDYARRIEGMTEEIVSEISADKNLKGSLTIRIPETVAKFYMPDIVSGFNEKHPAVSLSLINCSDSRLREELNSGRIDLAFLITDSIELKEVNVCMLRTENLVLVSSPSHPLTKFKNIRYQDIDGQTLLLPKTD
ncbi:hypothetical protein JCM14469_40280 [Desulfatiferula olefinivorans]